MTEQDSNTGLALQGLGLFLLNEASSHMALSSLKSKVIPDSVLSLCSLKCHLGSWDRHSETWGPSGAVFLVT